MIENRLLIALLMGLVSIFMIMDSRVFGRLNCERPLITCTIVGLILGDLKTGMLVGAQLEMVTLGMMSIGASGFNMNMGAIVGCALVILTGSPIETALTVAAPMTMLSSLLGTIGTAVRIQFCHMCDNYVAAGKYKAAKRVHIVYGPIQYAVLNFVPVFFAVYFGETVINNIVSKVPDFVSGGVTVGANLIAFYGFALLLSTMVNKNNAIWFFAGFLISAFSGLGLTAMSLIAICLGLVMYQIRYQDRPAMAGAASGDGLDELDDL